MALICYGEAAATAFQASRELPPGALLDWRAAIARYLAPRPGMRVLDLGASTGTWALRTPRRPPRIWWRAVTHGQ
jgi:precorrin-6B methylase 2